MKVLAINGSPRGEGSNTHLLIEKALEPIKAAGIEIEIIQLQGKAIRGCIACRKCLDNQDKKCVVLDDFNDILKKMLEADGIILGSPTFFTDVTAELKAVIDRAGFVAVVNGGLFRHKVGAAVVAVRRGGALHAFDTINHLFQMSQMFMVGSTYWNFGFGMRKGDVNSDEEGMRNMEDIGGSMAFLLNKLKEDH